VEKKTLEKFEREKETLSKFWKGIYKDLGKVLRKKGHVRLL